MIDHDVVDGIVLPAMVKNRARGITGCLWFDRQHFFQVLEGARDAIEVLFEVISRDDRHSDITLLMDEETGQRRFERFGMRAIDSDAARSLPTLIESIQKPKPKSRPAAPADRLAKWIAFGARDRRAADARAGEGDAPPVSLVRLVVDELAGWSEATPI